MATFRAQVVFPMFTFLPTDVITNTLHFSEVTPLGLQPAADALTPLIADFYEAVYTSARQMAGYVQPALAEVRWYDLSQPEPRVPYILPLGATIPTAVSNVPTEVACVLSFQGDRAAGIPQARRRGRIYLGGLATAWMVNSAANAYPTLNALAVAGVGTAAEALRDASITASCRWSVWSPTDQLATFITNGWVDNTPDTQRRRGVEAQTRNVWS